VPDPVRIGVYQDAFAPDGRSSAQRMTAISGDELGVRVLVGEHW
jgi:hypothetical protein